MIMMKKVRDPPIASIPCQALFPNSNRYLHHLRSSLKDDPRCISLLQPNSQPSSKETTLPCSHPCIIRNGRRSLMAWIDTGSQQIRLWRAQQLLKPTKCLYQTPWSWKSPLQFPCWKRYRHCVLVEGSSGRSSRLWRVPGGVCLLPGRFDALHGMGLRRHRCSTVSP